jgi:hypothetical protein
MIEWSLSLLMGAPWLAPALLLLALLLLEIERRWTRARRRKGGQALLLTYLLDTLSVLAAIAAVAVAALTLIGVLAAVGHWAATQFSRFGDWPLESPLLLSALVVAIGLLALGVILTRGRLRLPLARPLRMSGERRSRPELALATSAALSGGPSGDPPATGSARPSAPVVATRLVGAPPVEDAPAPGWARAKQRSRPSPAAPRARPAPWKKPPEQPGRGLLQRVSVGSDAAEIDERDALFEERAPGLAMLDNRRKPALPRREAGTEYIGAASAHLTASEQRRSTGVEPPMRNWWYLPLVVTTILLVLVVGGVIVYYEPLAQSLASLEQQSAALSPALTLGAAPAMAVATAMPAPSAAGEGGAPPASTEPAPEPQPAPPSVALVAVDKLNLRVAPGADQAVVTIVNRGQELTLLGEEQTVGANRWVKVRVDQLEGWVNSSYLE